MKKTMSLSIEEAVHLLAHLGDASANTDMDVHTREKIIEIQKMCGIHLDMLPGELNTLDDIVTYKKRVREYEE